MSGSRLTILRRQIGDVVDNATRDPYTDMEHHWDKDMIHQELRMTELP